MRLQRLACAFLFFLIIGCGDYDEGYEDGWANRSQVTFPSEAYKQGYTEGKKNGQHYEQGRQDAMAGKSPNPELEYHPKYRKGYRDAGGLLH